MGSLARKSASPTRAKGVGLRIAVAVQPPLFCETLCHRLEEEPDFIVVGRACNEDEIGKLIAKESPQVLVFDYEGNGPSEESVVGRLHRSAPGTRILVLASRSSDEIVERVLRAGAWGLVAKQLEFEVLVRAIHAVVAGEIWANRRATSLALDILTGPGVRVSNADLTKRE